MNRWWIFILLVPTSIWSQRFENQSYPRQFNISKTHVSSHKSIPGTYYIRPTNDLIVKKVETQFQQWLKIRNQATQEEKNQKLQQIEKDVCFEVAQEEFARSKGYSYVNQQELTVIICKPGFNNLELDIPLAEIRSFLDHYDDLKMEISNVKYAKDQTFICQQVAIQVPGTNKTYQCSLNEDAFAEVVTFPFDFNYLTK